ncbi:hypothetical protein K5X82_07300 [Halosquirtibacter xylanolyticus]|uniref:hypothetical protein n=1 Tax=Halosquirtibacter xylanolyticus TaxID=3374599 RepID=UPI0037485280|nr:hypothetical protein K5X82_07300 [Prolixibacteraceae bacterium]
MIQLRHVLKTRAKELKEGVNQGTKMPIYYVCQLVLNYCEGVVHIYNHTNRLEYPPIYGYVDMAKDEEERHFNTSKLDMEQPLEITKFFTEEIKAIFLTHEDAKEHIKRQNHNLFKPFVWIQSAGYSNRQFEQLTENN